MYTYKTASCLLCIRGSLRLAPNKEMWLNKLSINRLISGEIYRKKQKSNQNQV